MSDNVNRPSHYTQGNIECIDALAAATTNLKGIEIEHLIKQREVKPL